jgi:uncharacterized protein with ATP-grasp and redox domains
MRTYLDCIPCFVRQALDAVRLVTDDEAIHAQLLRDVLRQVSRMDMLLPPPGAGQLIHRSIRQLTDNRDPYREPKDRFNKLALGMLPELGGLVEQSANPMETAVRLAIAGNLIDFGVTAHLHEADVHEAVDQALVQPLDGDVQAFWQAVSGAEDILYLADNAGEIVFDRLLIEKMPPERVTVVVKGSPVINDATMADAQAAGLTQLVSVIDNGSDAPGTILADCSRRFRARFRKADLIIAKGQGNYEALSVVEKHMWFLLKAKCPVIARDIGCEIGSLILRRSARAKSTPRKVESGAAS